MLAPESTPSTARRVRRTLDDAGASLVGRRVLAMCSGGADSVALVALLGALPTGAAPARVEVLWVDHGVRADLDAERAAALAAACSIDAVFHEAVVTLDADTPGGFEAAARAARYEAALELVSSQGLDVVCTGHSANDQVEQALLALIGVTGRLGAVDAMPVARELAPGVLLVRPLLACTREQLEQACAAAGLVWEVDPTNLEAGTHARNAIRHRVVPELLQVGPGAGSAIARAGEREREAATGPVLARALLRAWEVDDALDLRLLAPLPAGARRELLAAWLRQAGLGRGLTARVVAAVDRLATLPARAACARVDLPGTACVGRDGYHLRIQSAPRHGGSRP